MWGSPHMAGFGPPPVMWGERGIGAPGGGDGIVPLHWKEDGLGASEPQNTQTSTTQTQQQRSLADEQANVLMAQIAFNEIAVPIMLAEPTLFGELIVGAVNMAFIVYQLQLRYNEGITEVFCEKGDPIGIERFTVKGKNRKLIDPKTKQWIEPDDRRNQGNGPHGGSWWKLYAKDGTRI